MGRVNSFLLLLLFIMLGCSEVYNPDIVVGDHIMYVEGMLTDKPGQHKILLRYTSNYNEDAKFLPVKGALVEIVENNSKVFKYFESSEGVYITDSSFSGKKGNSYVLRIESIDGNIFESIPQQLPEENLPINSVYGIKETRTVDYYNNYGEYILKYEDVNQVYADIPSGKSNNYYRFETQSTIEDATRLKVKVGADIDLVPLYQWNSYMSKDVSVIEVNTQLDVVNKIPITFLETDPDYFDELKYQFEDEIIESYDNRIRGIAKVEVETDTGIIIVDSIMYGLPAEIDDFYMLNGWILQIHQFSISKDAFVFWSDIKKLEEISGEIFDPIATQLRGNMRCLTDDNVVILGLFEVASEIISPAFINFYPSGESFLGTMLEGNYDIPYRGWQDSIPPYFWFDKIQEFTDM